MDIFGTIYLDPIKEATDVLMLVEKHSSRCGDNFNVKEKMDKAQVLKRETFVELVNDLMNKGSVAASDKKIINVDQ